jgi:hypothetical protein
MMAENRRALALGKYPDFSHQFRGGDAPVAIETGRDVD